MEKLKVFKMKLSVPLPDNHEELHSEQIRCKVRTTWDTGICLVAFILLRPFLLLIDFFVPRRYALAFTDEFVLDCQHKPTCLLLSHIRSYQ